MPHPTPWWKRYVDDVICITKEDQVDILFNHIKQMDDHLNSLWSVLTVKEVFPSWTLRAPLTPITQFIPQYIESPHIQTDICTGIQTILK